MGKRGCQPVYRGYHAMTVDLYESGLSVRQVAERLNEIGVRVSHEWVRSVLSEKRVKMRGYVRKGSRYMRWRGQVIELRGRHSEEKVRTILDRYADGEQPSVLSREHDIAVSTIEKLAERTGIMRTRYEAAVNRIVMDGGRSPIALAKRSARMYEQDKMSLTQISDEIGITSPQILAYLRREGVKLRSQSEGIILAKYGGPEERRRRIQEVCRLFHVEGLNKSQISKRTGRCWRFICNALESEFNPYRDGDFTPWHDRAEQYEREHGHVEGLTRLMLDWVPEPDSRKIGGDPIRSPTRLVYSRPEAA